MSFPGKWTLYYDWSSTGTYSSTSMAMTAAGKWTNGQGFEGTWFTVNGMLIFQFGNSKTTYAGNAVPRVVTGLMTNYGSTAVGSFYMLETSTPVVHAEVRHPSATHDSSGK